MGTTLTSMNVDNNSTYTAMGAPVAHAAPVHPQARPKDSSETPVLNASNWQDFATAVTGEEITEVEVEPVPLSAKLLSCVFAPLLPFIGCGFYTVDAKTEAAVLHMGQLTEMQNKPGLHCGWPCGREIRTISTKQSTMELPTSKIADAVGNPVMVSAILNYRVVDAKKALLHVENRERYVNTNAQAVLKQTVSLYSYDQLKQAMALVDARTLIVEGAV